MTRYFRGRQSKTALTAAVVPLLHGDLERKSIEAEIFAIVYDDAINRNVIYIKE